MLDDKDIQKLIKAQKEVFVTKEEFEGLIDIVATKEEMREMGKDIKYIKGKIDKVDVIEKEVDYIKNIFNIPAIKGN